jgi:ATP-dependent Clp protease ATP-binding subunit ClpC
LDLEIGKLCNRLKGKNLKLELDTQAREFLIQKGYDPTYGARPMRRAVEQFLEDPLAEELIKGKIHANDLVQVKLEQDKLVFSQNSSTGAALSGTSK